jgi:CNT family concentrative nucleoside transporter
MELLARGFNRIFSFASDGSRFVFGVPLLDSDGPWGFVFAVQVLPAIVFFAALMSLLYHIGVMQRIVNLAAWIMQRTFGVGGAEAIGVAANVFVGQTEAPLCVRPYLDSMSRSELVALMTGGFATVAGSTLFAYVGVLGGEDGPTRVMYLQHLLTASVLSAPAAFMMAKIIAPAEPGHVVAEVKAVAPFKTQNILDAITYGATEGVRLAVNIAAMLIALVALLALLNWPIARLGEWAPVASAIHELGMSELTLQNILGIALTPLAMAMGIPLEESRAFGALLGEKVIATELVAYTSLAKAVASGELSSRSAIIATYALCGFANFASIAIQTGALTALVPEKRSIVVEVALRAMVAGALASWATACVAAIFIPVG